MIILLVRYRQVYNICRTTESRFCFNIHCPGLTKEGLDKDANGCIGFARREDAQGNIIQCSTGGAVMQNCINKDTCNHPGPTSVIAF